MPITVFLADDNLLIREGVRALIELDPQRAGARTDLDAKANRRFLRSNALGSLRARQERLHETSLLRTIRRGRVLDVKRSLGWSRQRGPSA